MNRTTRSTLLALLLVTTAACTGEGASAARSGCFWRVEASGEVQLEGGRTGRGFPGAYGFFEDDGALMLTLSSLSSAAHVGFWLDMHVEDAPRPGQTGSYPLGGVAFRLMEGMNPADAEYTLSTQAAPAQFTVLERSEDWFAAEFTVPLVRKDAADAGPHALLEGAFRTPLGKTRCPQ